MGAPKSLTMVIPSLLISESTAREISSACTSATIGDTVLWRSTLLDADKESSHAALICVHFFLSECPCLTSISGGFHVDGSGSLRPTKW